MKIGREINGIEYEFELTDNELFNAFEEQEHKFDTENVKNRFIDVISDELAGDLAYEVRRQMDKYDLSFDYAFGEAITSFNEDLKEAQIEHTNLELMLENGEYEGRLHKRQLEEAKLSLEKYWGEYLTDPDKEL